MTEGTNSRENIKRIGARKGKRDMMKLYFNYNTKINTFYKGDQPVPPE